MTANHDPLNESFDFDDVTIPPVINLDDAPITAMTSRFTAPQPMSLKHCRLNDASTGIVANGKSCSIVMLRSI
jgi:hypothetical protein